MGQYLDEIMKNVNKTAKSEIMTRGLKDYDYERIPFTSPIMNRCLYGGLPVGKITEFSGEEHGGKTTSALDIVANYQQMEDAREVLWVDAENTFDFEWATKLGVNTETLYYVKPESQSAEDIFKIIEDAVQTGEVGLWVLDSIGVLTSASELDEKKDYNDKTYGGISQPLTRFSKKIEMFMQKTKCTGLAINQEREDLNSTWGGTKTPGGKAFKHCCAVRLRFSRGKFLDEKGNELTRNAAEPCGNIVQMSMIKNKTCPPNRRTGYYTLNYETGIDYLKDLVEVAIMHDIIIKNGAWFKILDVESGEILRDKLQGQASVYDVLAEDSELLLIVENQVETVILAP
jgi:recombination protein RecA